jgi:cyanuric acid amidohydrolase
MSNNSHGVNMQLVDVFRIPMNGPADMSGLNELIEAGQLRVGDIIAVLAKTEGNGCVNDFTREYATSAFAAFLAPLLEITPEQVHARIAFVMSGGTEGVLSPHATIFCRRATQAVKTGSGKRLAVGIAFTREFLPEEIGRQAQIDETARAVRAAMADAAIESAEDVHFVQIKCPLLTSERIRAARARGCATVTDDTYASMAYSRGASALGVAIALGETEASVTEQALLRDYGIYSSTASASAGIELTRSVIIAMGNSIAADSGYVIGHAVMRDAIDVDAVLEAFASVGMNDVFARRNEVASKVVNVLTKAEASPDGYVRGLRHTMLDDSDINSTRHARAAVGGLVAGIAGTGAVYVSGGAEHQGPAGGGPIAIIARVA